MSESAAPSAELAAPAMKTESDPASLLPRLRGLLPTLVPSMGRVAEVILANPRTTGELTISELAAVANTSPTTVLRLCREMSVGGYRDLRIALAREQGWAAGRAAASDVGSDIGYDDSLDQIITKITHADSRAVAETAALIDREELAVVVSAIAVAGRVDVFGVGASAFVAQDLAQKLHRIGVRPSVWTTWSFPITRGGGGRRRPGQRS